MLKSLFHKRRCECLKQGPLSPRLEGKRLPANEQKRALDAYVSDTLVPTVDNIVDESSWLIEPLSSNKARVKFGADTFVFSRHRSADSHAPQESFKLVSESTCHGKPLFQLELGESCYVDAPKPSSGSDYNMYQIFSSIRLKDAREDTQISQHHQADDLRTNQDVWNLSGSEIVRFVGEQQGSNDTESIQKALGAMELLAEHAFGSEREVLPPPMPSTPLALKAFQPALANSPGQMYVNPPNRRHVRSMDSEILD